MFAQYFGQFLINEGVVSIKQLQNAMEMQKETRVMLGVLAINHGYLNVHQVEKVHQTQMTIDKRFGEIAVDLKYITEEQLKELLSTQKNAYLVLGQALINEEVLTYESFSTALEQFKKRYRLSEEQLSSILKGDVETLISSFIFNESEKEKQWFINYVSLFAKNLIRFIDSEIRLEAIENKDQQMYDWVFSQELMKDDNGKNSYIVGDQHSMLKLASRFAQERIETADEMMKASVGELLNLQNGVFLVNLSNQGNELDMKPQQVQQNVTSSSIPFTERIRVHGSDFTFDIVVENFSPLLR